MRLKLSDADGRYRAGLGAWGDGSAGLDLWDRETRHRVSLADGAGVPSGVTLFDTAGTLRALLALGPEDRAAGTVTLDFWDRDGTYRAGLGGDGIDFYRAGDGHPVRHAP